MHFPAVALPGAYIGTADRWQWQRLSVPTQDGIASNNFEPGILHCGVAAEVLLWQNTSTRLQFPVGLIF